MLDLIRKALYFVSNSSLNKLSAVTFSKVYALCIFICLPFFSETASYGFLKKQRPFTIVIDAGHGGKDSGATGSKIYEKDITLKLALKLGGYLQQNMANIRVLYTRNSDKFVPLHQRVAIANQHHADVFFSIHCNALMKETSSVSGTETYVMGLHNAQENLSVAKRENKVVLMEKDYENNYQGYDPNSDEGHIMLSMFQNAHLSQSLLLAQKIENQFSTTVKRKSRGVKQAGFVVLRTTTMPSVLVETGFLSNKTEASYLNSEKGQVYMASAMYRAIKEYKNQLEKGGLGIKNQFSARGEGDASFFNAQSSNDTEKMTTQSVPTQELKSPPISEVYPSSATKNKVVFKVQLAASRDSFNLNSAPWKSMQNISCVKIGVSYKCLYGTFLSVEAAVQQQNRLRKEGFKDAFVVAFKNGQKIPIPSNK